MNKLRERMMDTIFKIKYLYYFLYGAFNGWKTEIWARDLEENYCCDGRECACGGASVRDTYNYTNKAE